MIKQNLTPADQQLPEYNLPPESDYAEAFYPPPAAPQAMGNNTNAQIVPEIALGSPQKIVDQSPPLPNQNLAIPLQPEPTPQFAVATTQMPQPSSQLSSQPPVTRDYWQTVVVPSQPNIFAPVTIPPSPPSTKPIIKASITPPPALAVGGQVLEEEEEKPKVIILFEWILVGLGGVYGLSALGFTGLAYLIDTSLLSKVSTALAGEFSRAYPLYSLFPLALALMSIVYFYSGFKTRDGSRAAWVIDLITLLGGTVVIFGCGYVVLSPIEKILTNPQFTQQEPLLGALPWEAVNIFLWSQWLILGAWLLLLTSVRQFRFVAQPLEMKKKIIMMVVSCLLIGIVGGYAVKTTMANFDTDLGYKTVAESAGFHIYKPQALPAGWAQTSLMSINSTPGSVIVGRDDFVEVYFDRTLSARVQGQPSAQIIVRQIDVPAGFDVKTFAQTLVDAPVTVETIPVKRADGQIGYAVEKLAEAYAIRALALKTSDNVLILLSTRGAQIEDMVALVNSFN